MGGGCWRWGRSLVGGGGAGGGIWRHGIVYDKGGGVCYHVNVFITF